MPKIRKISTSKWWWHFLENLQKHFGIICKFSSPGLFEEVSVSTTSLLSSQWLVRCAGFLKIVEAINVQQHQAWNQILQLSCTKRSCCWSHITNMLSNTEKIATYKRTWCYSCVFLFCFFQCTNQSGPRTLTRSRIWPSIQKVWGPLLYTKSLAVWFKLVEIFLRVNSEMPAAPRGNFCKAEQ